MPKAGEIFKTAVEKYKQETLDYAQEIVQEIWDKDLTGRRDFDTLQAAYDEIPSADKAMNNIITEIVIEAFKTQNIPEGKQQEARQELTKRITPLCKEAHICMQAIQAEATAMIDSAAMKVRASRHGFSKKFQQLPTDTAKTIIVKAWLDATEKNDAKKTLENFDKLLTFADVVAQAVKHPNEQIAMCDEA